MRKFLITTGLFLLSSSGFYILYIIIWGSLVPDLYMKNLVYTVNNNSHMYSRLEEVKSYSPVEILFLGSSHSFTAFDPRIFEEEGYSSFNLGSAAQTHIQTQYLLDNHLRSLNPEIVVYEVFPHIFTIDGVASTIDLVMNDDFNADLGLMVFKTKNLMALNVLFFDTYVELNNSKKNYLNKRITEQYVSGGYVEKKMDFNNEMSTASEEEWKPLPKQVEAFDENLRIIREKGAEVLLVRAPYTEGYKNYSNPEELRDFFRSRGIYLDFKDQVNLNDSLDFYDSHHLNQNGVEKFNNAFIEVLKEKDILN